MEGNHFIAISSPSPLEHATRSVLIIMNAMLNEITTKMTYSCRSESRPNTGTSTTQIPTEKSRNPSNSIRKDGYRDDTMQSLEKHLAQGPDPFVKALFKEYLLLLNSLKKNLDRVQSF